MVGAAQMAAPGGRRVQARHLVGQIVALAQVGGAGHATGQHEHVVVVKVKAGVADLAVADDAHVMRGGDHVAVGDGDGLAGDARAVEQVDDGQGLDLLHALGKEDGDALGGGSGEHGRPPLVA